MIPGGRGRTRVAMGVYMPSDPAAPCFQSILWLTPRDPRGEHDGKKACIEDSKTREEKDDDVVVLDDAGGKPKGMQKLLQ